MSIWSIIKEVNPVIIITVIACIVLAIILISIELWLRKKDKKVEGKKAINYLEHLQKLHSLKKSHSEKLEIIDKTTKSFFNEHFQLDEKLNYSELMDQFKQKNRTDLIIFCKLMQDTHYAEEKLTEARIDYLTNSLINLIRNKDRSGIRKIRLIHRIKNRIKARRERKEQEKNEKRQRMFIHVRRKRGLIEKARIKVKEARLSGWKNEQIHEEFKKLGWKNEDIDKIMR